MIHLFAESLAGHTGFTEKAFDKAMLCLLDFLSSVFSTGQLPWVRQAVTIARDHSALTAGGAAIIGTPYRVSAQDAAFANAVAGHSLVRDDMHVGSISHLGVVVLPTVLALAEREEASGGDVLEAIICGYEAGAKLGAMLMDMETAKRFRPTGLIGAFAASAACARLVRLDESRFANALSFAANCITGLNEWAGWGSSDMYFHPGLAARNGIAAMELARGGAESAPGSLSGEAGLFAALGKPVPDDPLLPFQEQEEILSVFFKQAPACNYAQTAAQVARRTNRSGELVDVEQIERVEVRVPYAAVHYPGCDHQGPFNSILQARMSIYFNVASALLHGDFEDAHYHDYGNTELARLIEKIDLVVDHALSENYPRRQGAAITVKTREGGSVSETLDDVLPASDEEVKDRFRAAAAHVLGEDQAEALYQTILTLRRLDSTREWLSLFKGGR